MLRIALCDDDLLYINTILKPLILQSLKAAETQAEICVFNNGNTLISEFENHKDFDIVLLDIEMQEINGKEIAERLRKLNNNFTLAFITAFSEEAINTIPFFVKAFIPKSFNDEKILEILSKLIKECSECNPKYCIFEITKNKINELIRLDLNEIYYFQNRLGRIRAVTKNEEFMLTDRSLKSFEEHYSLTGFCRIHTDLIVNIGKVYEIMKNDILLTNGVKLPVSRRRRNDLISAFADLMT